jgi:hypothetical protein
MASEAGSDESADARDEDPHDVVCLDMDAS